MTVSKVLDRLMAFAPPVLDAHTKPGVGRCILSTAVGLEVLKAFAIPAFPRPVHIRIANARYMVARARGTDPVAAVAVGGHVMDMRRDNPPGAWGGHLVIALPTLAALLDLNHGFFSRPAHEIHLDAAEVLPWPVGTTSREYARAGGVQMAVTLVEDAYYQQSPDWTDATRWRPIAQTLVHAIRAGRLGRP